MPERVWFVTGGSSGVGLALAKALIEKGERVAVTSRSRSRLEKQVGAASPSFLPLEVDLADETSVRDALERTNEAFGRIDVLVNNAGYAQTGAVEELSDAEFRRQFDINLFGVVNVLRLGIPYLRRQRSGHIFNISSIAGFAGFGKAAAYCASKFAVDGLSHSLADELRPFGISVTSVKPGAMETNFFKAVTGPARSLEAYRSDDAAGHISTFLPAETAAEAILACSESTNPPVDLFLGADAFAGAKARIERTLAEIADTETAYAI